MLRTGNVYKLVAAIVMVGLLGVVSVPLAPSPVGADTGPEQCPDDRPDRSRNGPDADEDDEPDFTVEFEKCRQRTFDIAGEEKTIRVYWTEENGPVANHLVAQDVDGDGVDDPTTDTVDLLIGWTEDAWRQYRQYGLRDPSGSDRMEVHVFDIRFNNDLWGTMGWCCTRDPAYEFDSGQLLRTTREAKSYGAAIAYHELFHAVAWDARYRGWVTEGTASAMEDKVTLPVDVGQTTYGSRVSGYLRDQTDRSITDVSYNAALLWTYVMEQLGTTPGEPQLGADIMTDFWQNRESGDLDTLAALVDRRTGGSTQLTDLWRQFTVTNWAKKYTGGDRPPRYSYVDSGQDSGALGVGFTYPDPPPTLDHRLGDGIIGLDSLEPWSAKYYRIRPESDTPVIDIEIRQDGGGALDFTLLGASDDELVLEETSTGPGLVRSIVNDGYDEVVVVVTASNRLANYRYAIGSPDPVLEITAPSGAAPADAGSATEPGKILAKLRVLSGVGGGTPITGINPADFEIVVGDEQVPDDAILSSSTTVAGDYWLLFEAPVQATDGIYDLSVSLGSDLADTAVGAVRYGPPIDEDAMVVVDRSGSMADFAKLSAAQRAAGIYVDSFAAGDQIGVASYANSASVDQELGPWATTQPGAQLALAGLTAEGATAIGTGLDAGLNQLVASGDDEHDWSLVLLSDGIETSSPTIADFIETYGERIDDGEKVPVVHTVALGQDADRAALERLARRTQGTYHFASEPAVGLELSADALTSTLSSTDLSAAAELIDIYRSIQETLVGQQRIYLDVAAAPATGAEADRHVLPIDQAATAATVAVEWADAGGLSVRLFDPTGTEVFGATRSGDHKVWKLAEPTPGPWVITVERRQIGPSLVETAPQATTAADVIVSVGTYLVEASVDSTVTLDVIVPIPTDHPTSRPVPVKAVLVEGVQPLSSANLTMLVTAPNQTVSAVPLFDDGTGLDATAGDGEFAGTIPASSVGNTGSYTLAVTGSGTVATGTTVTRQTRASFNLEDGNDGDEDGLPDWFETENGLDREADDATGDLDRDGLTNIEEFEAGTNPRSDDTDNGGENDGSEVGAGSNPLDPSDDALVCPSGFSADNTQAEHNDVELPGAPPAEPAAVLRYSQGRGFDRVQILRAPTASATPTLLAEVPVTGIFIDETLAIGQSASYWLRPVDSNTGRTGCLLGPRSITMVADPLGPEGQVVINEDAAVTSTLDVNLRFGADRTAVDMRVSDDRDLSDATWQPYRPEMDWQIQPDDEGWATVYAQFRSSLGGVSEVSHDTIRFDPAATPIDCARLTPTIVGTEEDDRIVGTAGDDIIFALGGNDTVLAGKGDDIVCAGDGNDEVWAGDGNDRAYGQEGNDLMRGQRHNDILFGGPGTDDLRGDTGDDTVFGGADADVLFGSSGEDLLFGDLGADELYGGAQDDLLRGGPENDLLRGGAGRDNLLGDRGDDELIGGAGADRHSGGPGSDRCVGSGGGVGDTDDGTCEIREAIEG